VGHWYCLYRDSPTTIECFDSLGIDTEKKLFLQNFYQRSRVKQIDFNTAPVQECNTSTCGLFCIYFIFNRLLNLDLPFDVLLNEIFNEKLDQNEIKVKKFMTDFVLNN
jgi:Ulp1 family protease